MCIEDASIGIEIGIGDFRGREGVSGERERERVDLLESVLEGGGERERETERVAFLFRGNKTKY